MSSHPSRIYLRRNGSARGVVLRMPAAWAELAAAAQAKLGLNAQSQRFFLETGDELTLDEDGLSLIGPGEVIYASGGSEWRPVQPEPVHASPSLGPLAAAGAALSDQQGLVLPPRPAMISRKKSVLALAKLAHHLQRERGASCAWVASGRLMTRFSELLALARPAVDAALEEVVAGGERIGGAGDDCSLEPSCEPGGERRWAESLCRMVAVERHAVDAPPNTVPGRTGEAGAFYAALRGFSAVIAAVLAEAAAVVELESSSAAATATFVQFSRFKESHALQRGFLSGALALPAAQLDSIPNRAFAELVVCVHQTKIHLTSLKSGAPEALARIIAPAFSVDEQLQSVQDTLEKDFDLLAVRASISVERCWELFSAHVDKLQRLEAVLAEEVQRSDQSDVRHLDETAQALASAIRLLGGPPGGAGAADELTDTVEALEALSPPLVKAELLRLLRTRLKIGARAAANGSHGDAAPPTKRKRVSPSSMMAAAAASNGASSSSNGAGSMAPPAAASPTAAEAWLIPLGELKLERRVGVGSSGSTYLAQWRGATVAVKVAGSGIKKVSEWRAEVAALTQLRHPHIVHYLGAVQEPPTHCLVLEYCAGGDLRTALRSAVPAGFVLRVAEGVASGMAYLHRRGIMHRDLKSANVLIDGGGVVKLSDFGVAVEVSDASLGAAEGRDMTAETGTLRWMAPEVARHERYRKSADVYSYTMVFFELLTHEVPFADRLPLQAAVATSLFGWRPALPADTPAQLAALIGRCWHATPAERPAFELVMTELAGARNALTEAEFAWLDAPDGHPVYAGEGGAAPAPAGTLMSASGTFV